MSKAIWLIVKMVYKTILRPLVTEAVENSETEIDDFILKVCDKLFDYNAR